MGSVEKNDNIIISFFFQRGFEVFFLHLKKGITQSWSQVWDQSRLSFSINQAGNPLKEKSGCLGLCPQRPKSVPWPDWRPKGK
jgi:hypothetical protein